jgi:hypothetical protein
VETWNIWGRARGRNGGLESPLAASLLHLPDPPPHPRVARGTFSAPSAAAFSTPSTPYPTNRSISVRMCSFEAQIARNTPALTAFLPPLFAALAPNRIGLGKPTSPFPVLTLEDKPVKFTNRIMELEYPPVSPEKRRALAVQTRSGRRSSPVRRALAVSTPLFTAPHAYSNPSQNIPTYPQ